MGFDREHLVTSIRTRQQNKATVTYWLLLDARRPMPSSGYLSAELNEAAAAAAHQAAMQGQQQQQQYLQGQSGLGHPSYPSGTRAQHGGIGHHHSGGLGDGHGLPQQRLVAERKWRLGWHARGHPSALMAEVYRVLQVTMLKRTASQAFHRDNMLRLEAKHAGKAAVWLDAHITVIRNHNTHVVIGIIMVFQPCMEADVAF